MQNLAFKGVSGHKTAYASKLCEIMKDAACFAASMTVTINSPEVV